MINHDFAGQEKDTRNVTNRSRLNYLVFLYLNELIFGNDHCAPLIMAELETQCIEKIIKIFLHKCCFEQVKR